MKFEHKFKEKQNYETGATRDNSAGKGRYDLFPPSAIKRVAVVYENGGKIHGDRNWEKGIPESRLFDSALRHTYQALSGMEDEDHLAHAVWNLLALMHFQDKGNPADE